MKIDRRAFLSFVAGGAAGSALSPLPWKLIDDISIWSQNWPWVPVPEGGKFTSVETVCSLCQGGCGIIVNKAGNRAIKIEGLEGHPVSNGGICGLGLSGLQLLYGPTRVKAPMQRVGERGSGKWQEISWDKALSIVADELTTIRQDGEAHKVACISGSDQGSVSLLMQRFLRSYGSSNFVKMSLGNDINGLALKTICPRLPGTPVINFDLENSGFILSFGSGLVDGWLSPVRMTKVNSRHIVDGKTRLIQIEDSLSNTAAKADKWVPINPGTEADLAFGIASFMVKHDLYDKGTVVSIAGFNELKEVLFDKYSLESVSEITGVDIGVISELSKSFAKASSPIAICGRGKGEVPTSSRDYIATHLLNILVGNLNKKGGIRLFKEPNYINWPSAHFDDISKASLGVSGIDGSEGSKYPHPKYLVNNLISDVDTGNLPLRALFVTSSNPCHTLHDTALTRKAFRRIPLVVNFSSFMDETVTESDLILPNHIYLERLEDVPVLNGSGTFTIGLSRPVVPIQHNTKHLGETVIRLAHMLGGSIARSFPWSNYESCLRDSLGSQWGSNKWISVKGNKKPWIERNLEPVNLDKVDFTGINTKLAVTRLEGNYELFPLVLVPKDSLSLPSGYIASPPFLIKSIADTVIKGADGFIDINPQTAEVGGLRQNDYVFLSTPKGKVKVKVNICEGIRPGVVTISRGLGHTAYDGHVSNKGINVNDLIGSMKDPILGHDAVWGIRARLVKA